MDRWRATSETVNALVCFIDKSDIIYQSVTSRLSVIRGRLSHFGVMAVRCSCWIGADIWHSCEAILLLSMSLV